MTSLSSTAQTLVNNVVAAIAAHRFGGTYRAGQRDWAVGSERTRGVLTGNVIAASTLTGVLDETEAELKRRGHSVSRQPDRGRLIVTPAA